MSFWGSLSTQEGMSNVMEQMVYFHDYMMMMLTIIMVFVMYLFIVILRSYSSDLKTMDSHFLELIWTVVPIFFLLFMALPSLYLLYLTEDVMSSFNLVVKAVGHQWYWEYQFSNGLSAESFDSYMTTSGLRLLDVDNRLTLPNLWDVMLVVTSADVLHSWAVPSLGVKADAIPGRLNYLSLGLMNYGVFYGQCSELCGTNHSFMPIVVESVNQVLI